MEHLTNDELIAFVSMDRLDGPSLKLASKVNGHIGSCGSCLERLKAFQLIYDEFTRLGTAGARGRAVYRVVERSGGDGAELEQGSLELDK